MAMSSRSSTATSASHALLAAARARIGERASISAGSARPRGGGNPSQRSISTPPGSPRLDRMAAQEAQRVEWIRREIVRRSSAAARRARAASPS
jgi:hypothetical protein